MIKTVPYKADTDTDTQTDTQIDTHTDRHTERHTDRRTDRKIKTEGPKILSNEFLKSIS